jgi:hypothetical protein
MGLPFVVLFVIALYTLVAGHQRGHNGEIVSIAAFCGAIGMGAGWFARFLASDMAKNLPALLAQCSDPVVVPDVIIALGCNVPKYHTTLSHWLIRMLPVLGSEAANILSPHHVRVLARQLDPYDKQLSGVILETLVHAGNRDSERAIQAYIAQCSHMSRQEDARIHAVDCLERLQARLNAEETTNTLLRGSEAPGDGSNLLLRQAAEPDSHHEELLRASE